MLAPGRVLTLAAAAAVLAAGCATAPSGGATHAAPGDLPRDQRERLLLTDAYLPDREGCTVTTAAPPPFARLADSAAAHGAVAERWRELGSAPGFVVLSLAVDTAGVTTRASLLATDLPAELAHLVAPVLAPHLRPLRAETNGVEGGRPWQHRVRVEAGSSPRFAVGNVVACRPLLRNPQIVERHLSEEMRTRGVGPGDGGRRAVVWLRLGEDGSATEVRVQESSGRPHLDLIARDVAAQARYSVATIDGEFVPVWVALPVTFQVPTPRRGTRGTGGR